jgi:hypothetical protein
MPIAPRPAREFGNEEGSSARQTQMTPKNFVAGPFLPAEPREEVLADPARELMTSEQILRWNQLVQLGKPRSELELSGVPLSRYAALSSGQPWDFNADPNRGGSFATLGRLDADGRPIIRTDDTWKGHVPPNEPGMNVITASPYEPLPDQKIVDAAWRFPHAKERVSDTRQPFYRFSPFTWEGFTDKNMEKASYRELTIIIVALFLGLLIRYLRK